MLTTTWGCKDEIWDPARQKGQAFVVIFINCKNIHEHLAYIWTKPLVCWCGSHNLVCWCGSHNFFLLCHSFYNFLNDQLEFVQEPPTTAIPTELHRCQLDIKRSNQKRTFESTNSTQADLDENQRPFFRQTSFVKSFCTHLEDVHRLVGSFFTIGTSSTPTFLARRSSNRCICNFRYLWHKGFHTYSIKTLYLVFGTICQNRFFTWRHSN